MYKYCIDNLSPLKRCGLNRGLFLKVKMCKYFIDNLSPPVYRGNKKYFFALKKRRKSERKKGVSGGVLEVW